MPLLTSMTNFIKLTRTWYNAVFIITCIFCLLNGILVTQNLKDELKKTFNEQLSVLSHNSQEVIATNYSVLDNIVAKLTSSKAKDIQKDFMQYTYKIGQYTNNIIFLTDAQNNVIVQIPNLDSTTQNLSAENRSGIKNTLGGVKALLLSNQMFIGPLVRVTTEKTWKLPIIRGIIVDGKHMGSVILVTSLEKFSDSLIQSNITLKLKTRDETYTGINHYFEADNDLKSDSDPHTTFSYPTILASAFLGNSTISISKIYTPLHGINRNISLKMSAKHVQNIFWSKFNHNLMIFCFCTFAVLFVVLLKISRLAKKVNGIEEVIVASVARLQHLIPGLAGFISLKRQEKCDSILVNIERFVSANDLIANTIEQQNDIILAHEKQIPELQKHFLSCMNALHEHSLCLIEKIDDIYHSKTHHIGSEKATKNLYDDPQKLWSIFEEIYHHSKSYEEYALSLADSFQKAQIISSDKKEAINLEDILRTTFANRYTDLTVTNFPNAKSTQPHKVFFAKAVEEAIKSLLEIGHKDDYQINLHIGHESISIEIALHITNKPINNGDIQLSLQKARLFSLLDEGFVGILRTENSLIFTIVYTENQDLNRTQRVVL